MCACLSVSLCTTFVQSLWRSEEGGGPLGTGITGCCELPCVYWEQNPLQEK